MGCTISLPDGADVLVGALVAGDRHSAGERQQEEGPHDRSRHHQPRGRGRARGRRRGYNNLTHICPDCYQTGVLYRSENSESRRIQSYYCNCCQQNLCRFHLNKHQIKLPLIYD